jgi:hypothetical protein
VATTKTPPRAARLRGHGPTEKESNVSESIRTRGEVYALIDTERSRQRAKWSGPHEWGSGDCSSAEVPAIVKAAVMSEECGEVSRAVLDGDQAGLRRELVQVAAVAVAWLESL